MTDKGPDLPRREFIDVPIEFVEVSKLIYNGRVNLSKF